MRTLLLFLALAVTYAAVSRVELRGGRLSWTRPAVTTGDEPHYLMAANSLKFDHDLFLQDDYRKVREGGAGAGLGFRGNALDHHTVLVDRATGAHALWQDIYDWTSHVDCQPPCVPFRRLKAGFEPRPSVVEVPAHPLGFPATVALAGIALRAGVEEMEPVGAGVTAGFCLVALAGLWLAARRAGYSPWEAAAAVVLAGIASPLLAYGRSFFSEPAAACALALALWALAARRPLPCGIALGLAAAIKPVFLLTGLPWAWVAFREGRKRDAAFLLGAAALWALAIVAFNLRLARTPFVSGTQGFVPAQGLESVGVLLFSNRHGLFTFAPWAIFVLLRIRTPWREPLVRETVFGMAPALLVTFAGEFSGGGICYGPRYFVPFLPWLALVAVACLRGARRWERALLAGLTAISLVISAGGALRYRVMFDQPVARMFQP